MLGFILLYSDSSTLDIEDTIQNLINEGDQSELILFKTQHKIFYFDEDMSSFQSNHEINIQHLLFYSFFKNFSFNILNNSSYKPNLSSNELGLMKKAEKVFTRTSSQFYRNKLLFDESVRKLIEKIFYPEKNKLKCFVL